MKEYLISDFMTKSPETVGADKSVSYANHRMNQLNVRHLPVLKGGQLVGIISERDIRLVESIDDTDPEEILVEEAYSEDPYRVQIDATLRETCQTMLDNKYGSVLVMDGGKLVGIFTWIDALKALTQALDEK